MWPASPNCLRLFWHFMRAAASRTFCTAGKSRPIRMAMIAMTTKSSMSVKARDGSDERLDIGKASGESTGELEAQADHAPLGVKIEQGCCARSEKRPGGHGPC